MAFAENPLSTALVGEPPTITLTSNIETISPDGSATLSWTTGATSPDTVVSVSIDNGVGEVASTSSNPESIASGSIEVANISATTTYILTATTDQGVSATTTATVTVVPYDYTTDNHNIQNAVGIGTSVIPASGHANAPTMLAVNGTIVAKRVKVTMNGWADYVFDDKYKLKPLQDVATYIDQNKHLPEMPSAQQIKEQGLSVNEMFTLQMKKIEELTLYLIDLEKKNQALHQRIDGLEGEK